VHLPTFVRSTINLRYKPLLLLGHRLHYEHGTCGVHLSAFICSTIYLWDHPLLLLLLPALLQRTLQLPPTP
jgi:hypothetical protein